MRILDVVEITKPIASPIRNAYIDFSKMTASLVAVVTDVEVDGRRVVGYGFNSNGRYGQGGLIRERFRNRILEAEPESLLNAKGDNLDPHKIWDVMMSNEKPGGHGERSVAVGTLDMAIWDATAKIANKPLFRLLAEMKGVEANPRVFVYAAGGYYYPGKDLSALRQEMRGYLNRGYNVVKMKIGGASLEEDRRRIEAVPRKLAAKRVSPLTPMAASIWKPVLPMRKCCVTTRCSGTKRSVTHWITPCRPRCQSSIPAQWPRVKTFSPIRMREICCAMAACARIETICSLTAHSLMVWLNICARLMCLSNLAGHRHAASLMGVTRCP